MNDEELDSAIAERFKVYEKGIRLPAGFKGRFIVSVRRKRILRRVWTLGSICAAAAVCAMLMSPGKTGSASYDGRPSLTARASGSDETARFSYLALLGYMHECFSRSRSSRRKEEERLRAKNNQ